MVSETKKCIELSSDTLQVIAGTI